MCKEVMISDWYVIINYSHLFARVDSAQYHFVSLILVTLCTKCGWVNETSLLERKEKRKKDGKEGGKKKRKRKNGKEWRKERKKEEKKAI